MSVTDVSSTASVQTTTAQTSKGASALSSDYETFLKMMTVQMQNQDPLNPVESTDFAVQLATFSQVEQQVQTNDYLNELSLAFGKAGLASQAQLIGRFVQSAAASEYTGGTIELTPDYSVDADTHVLVIRDDSGVEVGRRALDGAPEVINWSGATDDGQQLGAGTYTFAIEGYATGELVSTTSARTWGVIRQVQSDGTDSALILENGETVYESEVTAIR